MRFYLSILIMALLLAGCEKSVENFSVTTIVGDTDTVWASSNSASLSVSQLQLALVRSNYSDSFSLASGTTLQTGNLRVEVPASAFATAGTVATGTARVEYNLLQSKGDLIRFGKPSFTTGNLLNNLSTVYINVTKNGQALNIIAGKYLRLAFTDSLAINSAKGYTGNIPSSTGFANFSWTRNDSITVLTSQTGYTVFSNRQQWLGLAYPTDSAAQKSRVVLSMPSGFTNSNTLAFISYKNSQSVMQFSPDVNNRIWLAESVPTGKNITYITITKKGTDYWLGTLESTTVSGQNIRIVPEKRTLASIINYLETL